VALFSLIAMGEVGVMRLLGMGRRRRYIIAGSVGVIWAYLPRS